MVRTLACCVNAWHGLTEGACVGGARAASQWVDDYKDAGADMFTFHVEANGGCQARPARSSCAHHGAMCACACAGDPAETIRKVRATGMKVGIAIKPKTPVEAVLPYVSSVDMVLVMTVEPGFGGQSFMADMMPKVRFLRDRFPTLDIEVDGGLASDTIDAAAKAGANVIVAGSSVFKSADPRATIAQLREAVDRCL